MKADRLLWKGIAQCILLLGTEIAPSNIFPLAAYLQYLRDFKEYEDRGDISTCYQTYGKMLVGLEEKYMDLKTSCVIAEEFVTCAKTSSMEFCIQDGETLTFSLAFLLSKIDFVFR